MEILNEAPKPSYFIPLAEHQSVTPASFYDGPPVLHYYSDRCKLVVLEQEASTAPPLANLISNASTASSSSNILHANGNDTDAESRKVVEDIDVWVASDKLFIYSSGLATGLSIPYPSISLHAIQSQPAPSAIDSSSQGLYMQLVASTGDATQSEDMEPESISVTIIPTASGPPTALAPADVVDAELETEDIPEKTPVAAMFAALSDCSNLHPDPVEDEDMDENQPGGLAGSMLYQRGLVMPGETDGGLPAPMPGSGGWITAENMHEFVDEHGNWIGSEDDGGEVEEDDRMSEERAEPLGLGPGAGTTRQRGGNGTEDGNGVDGDGDGEGTKWRRTE